MATPVWPVSLPDSVLFRGFTATPKNNENVFVPTIGPEIGGPAMGDAGDDYSVVLPPINEVQLATFLNFWKTTVKGGSVYWEMPNFTRVGAVNGSGRIIVRKIFGQSMSYTPVGFDPVTNTPTYEVTIPLFRKPL